MWILIVCVHSGFGAMGKVSKTVASVVLVAVCYTVPNVSCLMYGYYRHQYPVPSLSCPNVDISICVHLGHK